MAYRINHLYTVFAEPGIVNCGRGIAELPVQEHGQLCKPRHKGASAELEPDSPSFLISDGVERPQIEK